MTKKFVFGVAVVAFAAVLMAPVASANCGSIRSAQTYNPITAAAAYWHAPSGDATGTLVGQAWQLGAPATFRSDGGAVVCNQAAVQGSTILYFGALGIGSNWDLGSCGAGCPAAGATLVTLAQKVDPTGVVDFLVDTVAETASGAVNFDYSAQGDHTMLRLPSPTVLSSGASAGNVNLSVQVPSIAAALYGPNAGNAVTGYKILSALSVTDPGTNPANYTVAATVPAAGGAASAATPLVLSCPTTGGADQWIATQLSFENGLVLSQTTSQARRVHCAGAIANPKYNPVPKKNSIGTAIQK